MGQAHATLRRGSLPSKYPCGKAIERRCDRAANQRIDPASGSRLSAARYAAQAQAAKSRTLRSRAAALASRGERVPKAKRRCIQNWGRGGCVPAGG